MFILKCVTGQILNKMTKKLIVNKPFGYMDAGEEFILSEDGKSYICEHESSFDGASENLTDYNFNYYSKYSISVEYAEKLVKEGILIEDEFEKSRKDFVNVFDEIDKMLEKYSYELVNLDKDTTDFPMCLRVEKKTVLANLIKVLEHLKSLKK